VQSIQDILFYMVTFKDNSFSDDLYPPDITVRFVIIIEAILICVV